MALPRRYTEQDQAVSATLPIHPAAPRLIDQALETQRNVSDVATPRQKQAQDAVRYWEPAQRLLESVRDYAKAKAQPGGLGTLKAKLAVARHRFWSAITGADIPINSLLGEDLRLPHPTGVVIHPNVQLGPHCMLFQQVTLGTGPIPGVPRLGANVEVGAGAKILGGVKIGDNARIGANAVVISDVPAWSVAVGIPAKIKNSTWHTRGVVQS